MVSLAVKEADFAFGVFQGRFNMRFSTLAILATFAVATGAHVAAQVVGVPGGAINPQTGQFYPNVGGGVVNPQNGHFYPGTGSGYVVPGSGAYLPQVPPSQGQTVLDRATGEAYTDVGSGYINQRTGRFVPK